MRRQLVSVAPLLAHYFPGLLPDRYHRFTMTELNAFIDALPRAKEV